ncbi:MAG: hypothetical protein E1N59_1719 [Puniceicoccaceae bacterium 5H]|nr:MAG: hypothetical protein E1N59_1719 [Puniceicoccaceae bacterium 5H]
MGAARTIYSTWGFHDELGDRVALTEELARQALKAVKGWRAQGLEMEVFALDGFWFDPELGYQHANRLHWLTPMGDFLAEVRQLGFTPGLWFSSNGAWLKVPEWQASLSRDHWHYSLIDGPFAQALEDALLHAATQWGVRCFKFDYAHLGADVEGARRTPTEAHRLGLRRFREIVQRLRERVPDVCLIGQNGFTRDQHHERLGWPHAPALDPALLEVFDLICAGDPHLGDCPTTAATRSLDLYADRSAWLLHQAGIPWHRIGDHGKLMGHTNTASYRGTTGLMRSHLAQLARGSRRDAFSGDPTLLEPSEVRSLRNTRAWFEKAWQRQLETRFIGPGEPTVAPWHGWLTGGAQNGLLYLVNSTLRPQWIDLSLVELSQATVLFSDGSQTPPLQLSEDRLQVELAPEQMTLIGLGSYAWEQPQLPQLQPPLPREVRLLPLTFETSIYGLEATLSQPVPQGYELLIIARAWDVEPGALHALLPRAFGAQNTRIDDASRPKAHQALTISVEAKGERLSAMQEVPAAPSWSDVSWVARRFSLSTPAKIRVSWNIEPRAKISAEVYAVRS